MLPLDEKVALRFGISIKTARAWIWLRFLLLAGRLTGDGGVIA